MESEAVAVLASHSTLKAIDSERSPRRTMKFTAVYMNLRVSTARG